MESLLGTAPNGTAPDQVGLFSNTNATALHFKYSLDVSIIASLSKDGGDKTQVDFSDPFKSLTISAQEIVAKINELLKEKLPDGLESLRPEDTTSEATAERVVSSITAFYQIFRDQNPDLSDEESLDKFMEEIKKGVQEGYDDAYEILEGLGAFSFEGIREGVEQTKILIENKLDSYYSLKRQELGLDPKTVSSESPEAKGISKENSVNNLHVVA